MSVWMRGWSGLALMLASYGSLASGASGAQPPLCASYGPVIERSLKVIARDITGVSSDELDAYINNTPRPGVVKPARVARAWAQIDAAMSHMARLGCEPYPLLLDPSDYYVSVFACTNAKRKDSEEACNLEKWTRTPWGSK